MKIKSRCTQKVLRRLGGCRTPPRALALGVKQLRRPKIANLKVGLGIPSLRKLLLLKSTFAAKTTRGRLINHHSGWRALDSSRAWRQGAGTDPPRFLAGSDAADPSAVAARWAATNVPARDKARQDPRKLIISCYKLPILLLSLSFYLGNHLPGELRYDNIIT